MKNPITRTKTFVVDHKLAIASAAGVVVGTTIACTVPLPGLTKQAVLELTRDQALQLLDDPNKCVTYKLASRMTAHIVVPQS